MAVANGVTEVPDSEDEPFTSSPEAYPYGTQCQLDGTVEEPPNDAPSLAGDPPKQPGGRDAYMCAERNGNWRIEVMPGDTQSLVTVVRADPLSEALQLNANEPKSPHQYASSLADTCDFSNQNSSVPTGPSSLQIFNQQHYVAAPAFGYGDKASTPAAKKTAFDPAIADSDKSLPPDSSCCIDQHGLAADSMHSSEDMRQLVPSLADTVENAYIDVVPAASTVETDSVAVNPMQHAQPGTSLLGGISQLQHETHKAQHPSLCLGEVSPPLTGSSVHLENRGCAHSPSPPPSNALTPKSEPILTQSSATDGAATNERCEGRKSIGSSKLHDSMNDEDIIQPRTSAPEFRGILKPESKVECFDTETRNADISTNVQLPSTVKQPQLQIPPKDMAECLQLGESAATAPNIDADTALCHVARDCAAAQDNNAKVTSPLLEATGATSNMLQEAEQSRQIQSRDQESLENTEAGRKVEPSTIAETQGVETAAEPASSSVAQTSLSEAHVTKDILPTQNTSAQETTLAELKAQKAALIASLAALPAIRGVAAHAEASDTNPRMSDGELTDEQVMAAAHKINKKHIKLLHEYNEIKDVGQGLMGLIADQRGVRIMEVQEDFGIDAKD